MAQNSSYIIHDPQPQSTVETQTVPQHTIDIEKDLKETASQYVNPDIPLAIKALGAAVILFLILRNP